MKRGNFESNVFLSVAPNVPSVRAKIDEELDAVENLPVYQLFLLHFKD